MTRAGASRTASLCRSCRTPKPPQLYVCPACWGQMPAAAQRALNQRGDRGRALARLRELYDHIDSGRPLAEVEITR